MGARRRSESEIAGDELFRAVEGPQGFAYISDGIDVLPLGRMIQIAKTARRNHNKSVTIINAWLRKWEPRVRSSTTPVAKED